MRRLSKQAGFRQIMPLIAAFSMLTGSVCSAQEKFPNELNSPIDEPLVVLPQSPQKVPVRPASGAVLASTDPLVKLVYETREVQRQRLLSTADHTPWQMMHGLLGLRQDFLINHNGQPVSGLEWIQSGPMFKNEPWFQKTQFGGRAHPFNKPYWFEGHINQSLAILAMCNIPLDAQFGTPEGPVTMRDMLKNAQMTANEKEEVTWTLWALSTYLPSDAEWVNAKGERWSIERLVQIEVGKKVGGPTSPCGGTHGLFALARARNVYLRTGKPLRGVWLEADQKVQKYIQTAKLYQNSNGTLSSNFFRGREFKQDFDKRMASSGHVLEFLMMALPQDRLKESWVRRAIEATANDLMANRKAYVSCSPLYHATDALSIYLDRVVPAGQQAVAQNPANTKAISSTKELKTADTAEIQGTKPLEMGTTLPAVEPVPAGLDKNSPPMSPDKSDSPAPEKTSLPTSTVPDIPAEIAPKSETPKTDPPRAEASKATGSATPDLVIPTVPSGMSSGSGSPLLQIPLPDVDAPMDGKDLAIEPIAPPVVPNPTPALPPVVSALLPTPEAEPQSANSPGLQVLPGKESASDKRSAVPETPVMKMDQEKSSTAVSPTVVASMASQALLLPMPVVSGEQVEVKAGLAESTASVLTPTPLGPALLFISKGNAPLTNASQTAPLVSSSTVVTVTSPEPKSVTASHPKQLTDAPVRQPAGSEPAQKQKEPSKPAPTRRVEWKSTPIERRKQIVFEEAPSV